MKHGISCALLALVASVSCVFGADELFQLTGCKGICQVRKPGDIEFQTAVKGKAYPFGTSVRTQKDGMATIQLSADDTLTLDSGTEIVPLLEKEGGEARRVVELDAGKLTVFTTSEGAAGLSVKTPVADCTEMHGRSDIALAAPSQKLDAYILSAQAASGGSVTISGPQFKVPGLKAGYSVKIATASDRSLTRILNTLGDYPVLIDNGGAEPVSISTSTKSTIRIWREKAPIGGREIVSVFATGPDGKGRERFAFAVGQPLVAAAVNAQEWTEEAESSAGGGDEAAAGEGEIDFDAAFGGEKAEDAGEESSSSSEDDFFSSGDEDFF